MLEHARSEASWRREMLPRRRADNRKKIEKEFDKEFRSPALEDASLKEALLNDASLRAFNARVHTST